MFALSHVWLYFAQSGLLKESNNITKVPSSRCMAITVKHTLKCSMDLIWYALVHKWIDSCNQSCVKGLTTTQEPPYCKG